MKKISLILALLILVSVFSSCSQKPYDQKKGNNVSTTVLEMVSDDSTTGCKAEQYIMDLTLDTANDTISGDVTVELTNTTDSALQNLCFRLFSAAISSGTISKATGLSTGTEYNIRTESDGSVIYVDLAGESMAPGSSMSIKLSFTSSVPNVEDRYGVIKTDNGKLYNMTFCFPQIAFLEDGEWFEDEYIPEGEARYNEMSDYYVTLKAPADYTIVSSGKSSTTDGVTYIEAPNVREMAIAACNFADVISKSDNGITYNVLAVDFASENPNYYTDLYNIMLDTAIDSTNIYSSIVGDYIYDEIDIVPMFIEGQVGGMEMPGFIQIDVPKEISIDDEGFSDVDYTTICENIIIITAHEMGHQWFYCAVGNNESDEPWLDESFTSYLEYYYIYKSERINDAANAFNKKYYNMDPQTIYAAFNSPEDEAVPAYINLPTINYSNDYGEIVYANGAWFLRKLELAMGSDDFFKMLSEWYDANSGKIANGISFVKHVIKHDSSAEVNDILNYFISHEHLN